MEYKVDMRILTDNTGKKVLTEYVGNIVNELKNFDMQEDTKHYSYIGWNNINLDASDGENQFDKIMLALNNLEEKDISYKAIILNNKIKTSELFEYNSVNDKEKLPNIEYLKSFDDEKVIDVVKQAEKNTYEKEEELEI